MLFPHLLRARDKIPQKKTISLKHTSFAFNAPNLFDFGLRVQSKDPKTFSLRLNK